MNNLGQFIESTRRKLPQFSEGKDSAVEKAHEDRLRKLYNLVKCRLNRGTPVRIFCQSALNYGRNNILTYKSISFLKLRLPIFFAETFVVTVQEFLGSSRNAIKDFWMSFIKKSEDLILADFEEKLINANVDGFVNVLITFKRKHPQLFNEVKGLLGNLSNLSQEKKAILAIEI